MVFLTLNREEQNIQQHFRDFATREIAPMADETSRTGKFPRENVQKMAAQGFMGLPAPKNWGGSGASFLTYILCVEEVSRACATTGLILSVHTSLGIFALLNYGSEKQKESYLPDLTAGKKLAAFALSEPGSGSDAAALRTTAHRKEDHYLLNGSKAFISNAGEADIYIVFATLDSSLRSRGITAFIVEKDAPGLIIGQQEKKMGLQGSATSSLTFDDCRVSARNLLGAEGEGYSVALSLLDGGRIGVAAQGLGLAGAACGCALTTLRRRRQQNKKVAPDQAAEGKCADLATSLEAARLLVYRAACLKSAGLPCTCEASMAKVFSTDLAMKAGLEVLDICSGDGSPPDFRVQRFMLDAKATQIYEGTNQIQRIVIAKSILDRGG